MWLVNQNHPLSKLTAPNFREIIRFTNLEAEAALWISVGGRGQEELKD
jgi:hypothetical protein